MMVRDAAAYPVAIVQHSPGLAEERRPTLG